ncbi:MAG: TlpA disulfide reductase family protein [Bacteroidota bacterium]
MSVKFYMIIVLFFFLNFSQISGQLLKEIDKEGIEMITKKSNDTTYVVNFWATWCSPCVREIGYFEELHRNPVHSKLKVVLINLDFPNQVEKRVIPFLKEKEISAPVLVMTDLNYNGWIDQVDSSWSGAIPATLIYNVERRLFLEKELTREELYKHVYQILN